MEWMMTTLVLEAGTYQRCQWHSDRSYVVGTCRTCMFMVDKLMDYIQLLSLPGISIFNLRGWVFSSFLTKTCRLHLLLVSWVQIHAVLTWWWRRQCHKRAGVVPGTDTSPCRSKLRSSRWHCAPLGSSQSKASRHDPNIHKRWMTSKFVCPFSEGMFMFTLEMMMPAMLMRTLGPFSSL